MRNPLVVAAAVLLPLQSIFAAYPASSGRGSFSTSGSLGPKDGLRLHFPCSSECRSNATHISWPSADDGCKYQPFGEAVRDCVSYLRRNVMPFDLPNLETLGFPPEEDKSAAEQRTSIEEASVQQDHRRMRIGCDSTVNDQPEAQSLPDGLSDGIVNRTVHLSLQTKILYPWADRLPQRIFYEYVLNFACSNEARTNWRPLLTDAVKPIINDMLHDDTAPEDVRVEDVVKRINQQIWTSLGKAQPGTNVTKPIHFISGQTPLIFDPMSVIAFGYASCTGMSILLVFALRAAGIPARLVGTPDWNGVAEHGNHNWVEVWTPLSSDGESGGDENDVRGLDCGGGQWRFLEPGNECLDDDPCSRWFCNKDRFDGKTRVYATRYDREASEGVVYPLAWDENNHDVPGEDRTDWYTDICSRC